MITPQEVEEHAFSKASFGGYNMGQVDEFLDLLTGDYTTLYKENAALKAKMKVLADKVEEYRATEDSMRKTLLTVQKASDQIMAEAEQERDRMLTEARGEAQTEKQDLVQELNNEKARLAAARNSTMAYIKQVRELHQHELEYLSGLDKLTAPVVKPDRVSEAAAQIDASMEKEGAEIAEPAKPEESFYEQIKKTAPQAEKAVEPEPEDGEDEPTRRIDFNDLKFGKDYEIK